MSNAGGGGAQLITMLVTFMLIAIPIAFLNANIAKRKGKSAAEFGWLSVIPFVGYFVAIYLVSLTDKALMDKVDKILESLAPSSGQPPKPA
jgi:uncharacterized membrane protein (GlpM family)